MNNLVVELNEYNYQYYTLNNSNISDYNFDMKLKELEKLEVIYPEYINDNSPTKRVGGDVITGFNQIQHKYPMLSLSNTYSKDEVADFIKRVEKSVSNPEYVCELKFDGVAVSLYYEYGKLIYGVTRGNGEEGDDITNNIKTIKSIPLELFGDNYPDKFEIRGEVVMPHKSFNAINEERKLNGEKLMANPRNAASGSVKQLNSATASERNLDCYLYSMHGDNLLYDNHYDNLVKSGFKVSKNMVKCKSIDEIFEFINDWEIEKSKLPFDIDGIVIKVNNIAQQEALGISSKSPKWAVSYKYKAEEKSTKLLSVDFQVGRTGAVTPVANLEPLLLAGTVVRRASMHNEDIMKSLGIKENDYLFIEKAGEIIPQVTRIDLLKSFDDGKLIEFPTICPECGTELIHRVGESAIYCPNADECKPQILGKYMHFICKGAMDIKNLGESKIKLLLDNDMLDDVSDLYNLSYDDLYGLQGENITLQERSARIMIEGIEKSKLQPAWRVLYGLGIKNVGSTLSKQLMNHYKSFNSLSNTTYEELINLPDIGDTVAKSIID